MLNEPGHDKYHNKVSHNLRKPCSKEPHWPKDHECNDGDSLCYVLCRKGELIFDAWSLKLLLYWKGRLLRARCLSIFYQFFTIFTGRTTQIVRICFGSIDRDRPTLPTTDNATLESFLCSFHYTMLVRRSKLQYLVMTRTGRKHCERKLTRSLQIKNLQGDHFAENIFPVQSKNTVLDFVIWD